MAAIQLDGLTKRFGPVVALDDVDLTVEEGEIFGFLGPNGAGKSTTIDVLLDFVRPTEGDVRVLGMDAQQNSVAIRRRVGVLPDGYHVYNRLTGRQHVQFAIDAKGADDDPDDLLARVGVLEAANRRAGGYSKGMRQRLVLAMALTGDPDLLVLDEPSTGLDPNGAREMRRIIRQENDRGTTVFFSSHILEQVEAICDRVAIINEGRIVTVDTIEGLRAGVGEGDELEITVDVLPGGAVETVRTLDGVREVVADGTHLTVRSKDASKAAILNVLESAGARILDFTTRETSLEELFARFTGETMDGDADAAGGDDGEDPPGPDDGGESPEVAQ